jgi:hypothetical protein
MSIKLAGITQPVELTAPLYQGSHFTWAEATRNGTRIPESTNFDGVIIPAAQITSNIVKLARELDKVRGDFGDRPIQINSWLRPPDVNKEVGGVSNSQHLLGWAADIVIEGYTPHQVAAILTKTWAGGLGDSSIFTHLDLRHLMGHASARWNYGFA